MKAVMSLLCYSSLTLRFLCKEKVLNASRQVPSDSFAFDEFWTKFLLSYAEKLEASKPPKNPITQAPSAFACAS